MKNKQSMTKILPSFENPFFLDEDEEAVILQTFTNFQAKKEDYRSPLFMSGSDDDLEDKLARAERVINFLFLNILISNQRIYPLGIINAVAPEIERLYNAIRETQKKRGKKKIESLKKEEIQNAVLSEYNNNQNEFKHINEEHLKKISYVFTERQARRDFIGPILERYILSKELKSPGAQKLYIIYNQMQKYINKI
ncbi:MAG: hypothetical protein BWY26_01114 [Elusimicrobia bacterium ADurb.Bin231]|nr:MAG: hypothetical protein BWY26_01114 [Elusimicrobia bacterium ADurb.Bin231]